MNPAQTGRVIGGSVLRQAATPQAFKRGNHDQNNKLQEHTQALVGAYGGFSVCSLVSGMAGAGMSDQAAINDLRELVDYLEEKNRQLEEALVPDEDSAAWSYGLSKTQAALFKRLTQTDWASRTSLMNVMELVNGTEAEANDLKQMVHKLRKRLEPHGYVIRTIWGQGYRLERVQ